MTNMISRRLIAGLALATLSLSFAPAQADTLDNIKKAGKVRIAIDTAIPPFGMTDDKLQPTGSDVETAQLLAKDLGVALEIVTTTGPTRIPMLQTEGGPRRLHAVDHARSCQGNRLLDSLCRSPVGRGVAEHGPAQGDVRPGRQEGRRRARHDAGH